MPIGGLKEKLLAAHRGGIDTVLIPEENRRDLQEIPKNILDKIEVLPVKWIDEVLEVALAHMPTPAADAESGEVIKKPKPTKGSSQKPIRH